MTWVFIVYLGALIGLALWSRRETRTVEGYFLAGRKLPWIFNAYRSQLVYH